MMYNWISKNRDKDLIYQRRLELVKQLNFDMRQISSTLYMYIMTAELGIIL